MEKKKKYNFWKCGEGQKYHILGKFSPLTWSWYYALSLCAYCPFKGIVCLIYMVAVGGAIDQIYHLTNITPCIKLHFT